MRKNIFLAVMGCLPFMMAQAQKESEDAGPAIRTNKYSEYNYDKRAVKERKAVPFPSLREADAVYAKRIQRIIDVREKKNLPMKWPKNPLWGVLKTNIVDGEEKGYGKLKAYKSDSLTSMYTVGAMEKR